MYSVILADDKKLFSRRQELYDLRLDAAERINLYEERGDLVEVLASRLAERVAADRQALAAFNGRVGAPRAGTELTPDQLERLRALGYIR